VRRLPAVSALLLVSLILVAPFLWTLSTALKGTEEVFSVPPRLFPQDLRWQNFSEVLRVFPFWTYAFNSLVISLIAVVSNVLLASLAAYPLARMHFRGRSFIFLAILGTMMVPEQVLMIPIYRICLSLGLLNTFAGVILPFSVNAFGIFLMRQFYRSIPRELDDAACIDGCTSLGIWWHILVPLTRPAMATLAVFIFVGTWGNFLWPLVVLQDNAKLTLPIGLSMLVSGFSADYRIVAAGAILSIVPVLIVFVALQRYIVRGMLAGSLKG
jgi:putative chitobiose transport system permease protein